MVASGNPRGRGGSPSVPTGGAKFYVCGPCLHTDGPFIIKADSDGLKAYEEHKAEAHGKAAAE
jgi:hypothetical protein